MESIKCYWIRLNCILGYPLLLLCDCFIVLLDSAKWFQCRVDSEIFVNKMWHKHDKSINP